MKRLLQLLSDLYCRLGRRYLLADPRGRVVITRVYTIFPMRWDLPNLLLHNVAEGANGEVDHDHGRWTMSLVLSGGYVEVRNGVTVLRPRGSFSLMSPNERHRISSAEPGTWSLFAIGWRTRTTKFYRADGLLREGWQKDDERIEGLHLDTPDYRQRLARRRAAVAKLRQRNAAS